MLVIQSHVLPNGAAGRRAKTTALDPKRDARLRTPCRCYGRGGEIANNRVEDQEITVLALNLLQVSRVYINTLMIQRVLSESAWTDR
jgi:TnpA family transposase